MPKLNVPALKRLLEERHKGVKERFCEEFGCTRKSLRDWMNAQKVTDSKMIELCDYFGVNDSVLNADLQSFDKELYFKIYETLKKRATDNNVSIPEESLIHWTSLNYQNFIALGRVETDAFDLHCKAMEKKDEQ
ncbi:transcription regulator [uncultured Mediterranean phage uvMED]|nr:transcription regulator [uncultured Mediterranean phage uvMED]